MFDKYFSIKKQIFIHFLRVSPNLSVLCVSECGKALTSGSGAEGVWLAVTTSTNIFLYHIVFFSLLKKFVLFFTYKVLHWDKSSAS